MRDAALPVLRSRRDKYVAGIVVALLCGVLYTVPNRLTAESAALITPSAWEQRIPFLPQTVWFYLAQYPLLAVAYVSCASLARCARFLCAVVAVQAFAAVVFLAVPLRYPRELHVLAADAGSLTLALAQAIRAIDAPVNCLPSLHVTSCLLGAMLLERGRPLEAAGYWVVAVASMASTLTFKQHYAIDLVAAAVLSLLAWRVFGAPREATAPSAA